MLPREPYNGVSACVRIYGDMNEWCEVHVGECQGFVMSPWSFKYFWMELREEQGE